MGFSWTSYPCECGGEVREEWGHDHQHLECSECSTPKMDVAYAKEHAPSLVDKTTGKLVKLDK